VGGSVNVSARLQLVREQREGTQLVRVQGEIDLDTAERFAAAIETPERIIVDFAECRYMDSTGLAVLLAKRKAVGLPFPLVMERKSFFRKLLRVAGVDKMFSIYETLDDALTAERSRILEGTVPTS